ncbi:hypothetical protein FOCC_FOCC006620 [Frankliniella occidentalis]|nr:hypothetical protein FOCC_FOCC006620 [Frankliniella occidentalis]
MPKLRTVELAFFEESDFEYDLPPPEEDEGAEDDDIFVGIEGSDVKGESVDDKDKEGDVERKDGNVIAVVDDIQVEVDDVQGDVDVIGEEVVISEEAAIGDGKAKEVIGDQDDLQSKRDENDIVGELDEIHGQVDVAQGRVNGVQAQEDDVQSKVVNFQGDGVVVGEEVLIGEGEGCGTDSAEGKAENEENDVEGEEGEGKAMEEENDVEGEEDEVDEDDDEDEDDDNEDDHNEDDEDVDEDDDEYDVTLDDIFSNLWDYEVEEEEEQQREPDSSLFEALRSLLLPHEATLHHLKLDSPQLLPLLDPFASGLQRLTLTLDCDHHLKGLQQMTGLKHLTVFLKNDFFVNYGVAALLKSCPSPLQRLELRGCTDDSVRALGAVGITSLQHLVLSFRSSVGALSLGVALAGLPNLRSLRLLGLHNKPTVILSGLSAAAMPKLAVIVFTDGTGSGSDSASVYSGYQDCQDLVRRASMPLHVVAVFREERDRHMMFFRHPAGELCPLCAEAEAAASFRVLKNRPFERIQVE